MEEKLAYVHNNPEIYFMQKARNGGYIYPICGNGSGKDGTGVKPIKGQTFRYKCFKCGTSGDVINFYAAEHHLSNADAIGQVFKIYGLDFVQKNVIGKTEHSQVATVEEIAENLKLANVVVPSDRVIIPTSPESYVARAVDEDNRLSKMKAGASNIFNVEVLKTSQQNVVIVEGEFDALSIIEAGNEAVALDSTTNADKFLNWVKENVIVPKKPLIIDLDNDETGKKQSKN